MSETKCSETVVETSGFGVRRCHRIPRTEEQIEARLCGLHLAARRRREKGDAKRNQRDAESDAVHKQASAWCEELSRHGINARPHYDSLSSPGRYTGKVVAEPVEIMNALGKAYGMDRG
jgi:hypothetical protein